MSEKSDKEAVLIVVLGILLVIVFVATAISSIAWNSADVQLIKLKRQAIENNFAEYDSKTGVWQWKIAKPEKQ